MSTTTHCEVDLATLQLTGRTISGDDPAQLAVNTRPGHCWVASTRDPLRAAISTVTDDFGDTQLLIIPAAPPRPEDSPAVTWQWSPAADDWAPMLTPAAVEANARAERTRRLVACDWTQLPDVPAPTAATWASYRQALRDITTDPNWPNPTWPPEPTT